MAKFLVLDEHGFPGVLPDGQATVLADDPISAFVEVFEDHVLPIYEVVYRGDVTEFVSPTPPNEGGNLRVLVIKVGDDRAIRENARTAWAGEKMTIGDLRRLTENLPDDTELAWMDAEYVHNVGNGFTAKTDDGRGLFIVGPSGLVGTIGVSDSHITTE